MLQNHLLKNSAYPQYLQWFAETPDIEPAIDESNQVCHKIQFISQASWRKDRTLFHRVKRLGKGAFADVYQGTILPNREKVALKVVMEDQPLGARLAARESSILTLLQDTGLVPKVHGVARDKFGHSIIAMEYLKSYKTLEKVLSKATKMKPRHQINIALRIAEAISKFHTRKVLHNDLKVDNVMIDISNPDDPKVKVIDFGHASFNAAYQYGITHPDQAKSADHLAPEVRMGGETTAQCDVYSYGMMLKDMVAWIGFPYASQDLKLVAEYCMDRDPGNRPSLDQISTYLRSVL